MFSEILSEILMSPHWENIFWNTQCLHTGKKAFWNVQCPHGKILPEIFNAHTPIPHTPGKYFLNYSMSTTGKMFSELFNVHTPGKYFLKYLMSKYSMSPHRENAFWIIQCPHTREILSEIFNVEIFNVPTPGKCFLKYSMSTHLEIIPENI